MNVRRPAATRAPLPRLGRLANAALLLSVSFVLSRVLGVLRNVAIADIFGNSRAVEAYFAAFRIPDTMFMLVSGGALASAFVPMFAGLLEAGKEDEAWDVASTVLNSVLVAMALFAVVAFILAPQIMDVLVGGYKPGERSLTIHLTRIMLLQPIFLGVSAIISSVLQTYNRFLLTAVAPLVYNLAVILGALLLGASHGVEALAWAVVAGALAQLVLQLPGLGNAAPAFYRCSINWASPGAREVMRLFTPRVVGLAAFQAMLLITLFLAAGLPQGNVAAINYAWPLIMFPVGALGTAAATATFPTLSRLVASEEVDTMRGTINRSLRLILFLSIPAAVGLIVLRRPIVNAVYNHGQWTGQATEQTAFALLFYALALAPLALIEVLARAFYAMKDTVTPVRIAIVAVVIDAVLSVTFVHTFPRASGQGGLALATAIANTLQVIWLTDALDTRLGGIGMEGLMGTLRDTALASGAMGLVLYVALDPLTAIFAQHGIGVLVTVAVELVLGASAFLAVVYMVGAPELTTVRALIFREK